MIFWAAQSVWRIRLSYYHKRCESWEHIADDHDERVPPPYTLIEHMPTRSFSHTTDALINTGSCATCYCQHEWKISQLWIIIFSFCKEYWSRERNLVRICRDSNPARGARLTCIEWQRYWS